MTGARDDGQGWDAVPPEQQHRSGADRPQAGQPGHEQQQGSGPNGATAHGGAAYGGAPYGGAPYGGAPYGDASYGGAPYGGASYRGASYGGAPYSPAHGGASHSSGPYGGAPYGGVSYPAPSWGAPGGGYGWAPPVPPQRSWPHGPGRPGQAMTAGALAFIAGGIAILWGLVALVLLAGSDGGRTTWLAVLIGLPAGALCIAGGARLLAGRDRWFVVGGAGALALVVLLDALLSAAAGYGTAAPQAVLLVLLLPVPTVAAVLAALPVVGGWVDSQRGRDAVPPSQQPSPW